MLEKKCTLGLRLIMPITLHMPHITASITLRDRDLAGLPVAPLDVPP